MTDEAQAIALVQRTGREALSTDQLVQLHLSGQLRPLPGAGVRVVIVGSLPGFSDEPATFHEVLAHELVRRGAAAYA